MNRKIASYSMRYIVFLVLIGFTGILSTNVYAMPSVELDLLGSMGVSFTAKSLPLCTSDRAACFQDGYMCDPTGWECGNTKDIFSKVIDSPLKQIKSGIALVDIKCSDGKYPAIRYDRMRVACVSLDTESKLVMRGWATMRLAMPGDNISEALCNNYEGKWHKEYNGCRDISDLQCSLIGGKFVDKLKICENGICPERGYTICVAEPKKLDWKIINSDSQMIPLVFQVVKDEKIFDIEYGIIGGMIKNMTFSNQSNSILVEIDSVDKGNLVLGIPRNLLDAKMDYCPPRLANPSDDRFFVLLDGEEIAYDEILTTNEIRGLQLKFAENSTKLEIIAACLI